MTRDMSAVRAIATVIALALLGTALPAWSADPAPAARLPVPADGDVAQWRKKIRDAFEVEYRAAKESGEPATLLDKLRKDADSASEPAKKYAFLLEAEDVAAQHDDAVATLAFVDQRAALFQIDCLAERSKTLSRLAGPKTAADLTLLEQATATATKAAAAERFDIATESTALAIKIAQAIDREQKAAARRRQQRKPAPDEVVPAANGVALIKSALDLQKRISKRKDLFTASEEAKAVLAKQPDDPAANAAVGTYLCFVAQNWAQGLPHLKKSSLPVLGELATEELALGDPASADAAKVFPLAGKWWDAAEAKTLTEDERAAVHHHAAHLYAAVRPRLADPLEIRVANTRGGKELGSIDPVPQPTQFENSIGMKLTLIPAGTFQMGSDDGEPNEKPVHEVRITKPFYLGVYEVTNTQWRKLMGDVPGKWSAANRPVEQVSWDDAVAFCRKLSERQDERVAGRAYRLPTEAEWEYACRAGARTQFSFGDDAAVIAEHAWLSTNSNGQTHPVGLKKANAWGLHDMHGNVWEWCHDWKGDYLNDGTTDPQGPPTGAERIWRGGALGNTPQHCRSAMRGGNPPAARFDYLGFRVAMSLPERSGVASKPSDWGFQLPPDVVFRRETGNAYKVFHGNLNLPWPEAKRHCEKMGGHLAIIDSPEEQAYVTALLAGVGDGKKFAIGATNAHPDRTWRWVDASLMSFPTLANVSAGDRVDDRFLSLSTAPDAPWIASPAAGEHVGFVCEWEKLATGKNVARNSSFEHGTEPWELRGSEVKVVKDGKAHTGTASCVLSGNEVTGIYHHVPLSWGDKVTITFWAESHWPTTHGGGEMWLSSNGPGCPYRVERVAGGWTLYSTTMQVPDRNAAPDLGPTTKVGFACYMQGSEPVRVDDVEIHIEGAADRPPGGK